MTVSPDGTMWFVTFPYLYRLSPDGRWSEFPDDPGTEVPAVAMEPEQRELARSAASVRTRAVFGPDGTLWFATGGGVVSVDRHDQWRTLADPDGWWPNIVGALALDREDQALFLDEPWIRGYPSGEVFQAELGSAPEHLWPPYVENGLGYPASLAVDHDGWIWTGGIGPHTLWRVSPDLVHRTPVRKGNGLLSADVLAIEASPSGDVWVARMGASRAESDGTWTTYTREQGLTSELVTAIAFSGDGSTWVGSTSYQYWTGETQNEVVHPSGVSRISATGAVVSFSDDRIGDSFVSALSVHDSGDVWVGTLEGLFKLDSAGAWHDVRLPAQPDTVPITAMVPDAIGRMWVGTMCHSGSQEPAEAGCIAVRKTDGSWSAPSGFKVIYDGYVSDVVADEAGNVWLTMSDAAGSHLHHVHADGSLTSQLWPASNSSDSMGISDRMARIDANGSMSHVGPDEGLDAVAVADVETDTHGATWFATYWYGDSLNPGTRYGTNVWRLNSDETWSVLDEVGGVPSVDVTQIEADAEGTLWFGTTEHGLVWRTSDGAWQTDTTRREILTLRRDTEGTVWAGTGDGAVSLTADGVSDAWTTADGLSANRVLDIAFDTSGRPWFATELGGVSVLLE